MKTRVQLRRLEWLLIAGATFALASCGGGGGSGGGGQMGPTDFTSFVKQTVQNPATAEPIAVNDLDFSYTDEPDAFDDVL